MSVSDRISQQTPSTLNKFRLGHSSAKRGPIPARITKRRRGPTAESAAKPAPRAKSTGANRVSNDRLRPSTAPVLSAMSARLARS